MDRLHDLFQRGYGSSEEVKAIMACWKKNTMEPYTKEKFYQDTAKLIAHLKKEPQPWDTHYEKNQN